MNADLDSAKKLELELYQLECRRQELLAELRVLVLQEAGRNQSPGYAKAAQRLVFVSLAQYVLEEGQTSSRLDPAPSPVEDPRSDPYLSGADSIDPFLLEQLGQMRLAV